MKNAPVHTYSRLGFIAAVAFVVGLAHTPTAFAAETAPSDDTLRMNYPCLIKQFHGAKLFRQVFSGSAKGMAELMEQKCVADTATVAAAVAETAAAFEESQQSDVVGQYIDKPYDTTLDMTAMYSGACAEHVALFIRVMLRAKEFSWSQQSAFLNNAIAAIEKRCPKAVDIYLTTHLHFSGQGNPPVRSEQRYQLLTKSSRWKATDIEGIEKPFYSDAVITLMSPVSGAFLMDAEGSLQGIFHLSNQLGIPARFTGKFTQTPVTDRSRGYYPEYVAQGEWYGFGDRANRCKEPKNGYAHWGTYRIKLSGYQRRSEMTFQICPGNNGLERTVESENLQWNRSRTPYSNQGGDERTFYTRFNPPVGVLVPPDEELEAKRKAQEAVNKQQEVVDQQKARSRLAR